MIEFWLLRVRKQLAFTNVHTECGEAVLYVNSVQQQLRQIKEAGTGSVALHNKLWSHCTCPEVMPYNMHWVDELLRGDHHLIAE